MNKHLDIIDLPKLDEETRTQVRAALVAASEDPLGGLDVDDEDLIRYADGSMTRKERQSIAVACRENVVTAMIVGDFVKEYAPVRSLVKGLAGWDGPLRFASGRLPRDVSEQDWRDHMDRCPRSKKRTDFVASFVGKHGGDPVRTLQIALNAAIIVLAVCFGFGISQYGSYAHHRSVTRTTTNGSSGTELGVHVTGQENVSGPDDLEQRTQPTKNLEVLRAHIEVLEVVSQRHPNVRAYYELLLPMYLKCADLEKVPELRKIYLQKAQQAQQFVDQHPNSP